MKKINVSKVNFEKLKALRDEYGFKHYNALIDKIMTTHIPEQKNNVVDIRTRIKSLLEKYYTNIPDIKKEDLDPDHQRSFLCGSKYAYKMVMDKL